MLHRLPFPNRSFLTVVSLSLVLCGCFSPKKTQQATQAKVDDTKAKIHAAGDDVTDKAKAQVFAAGLALDHVTANEPSILLGKTFLNRAQITLGPPAYQDAIDYERIINGLLETNVQARVEAARLLAVKDSTITGLQSKLDNLGDKLVKAEGQRDTAYARAASEAETWVKLKRWLRWSAITVAFLILLPILLKVGALVWPMLGPIASILDSIVGGFVKMLLRLVPAATEKAGVVAKDVHEKTYAALEDVVQAVQRAKMDPAVKAAITPELQNTTDATTRKVIQDVKTDLELK